MRNAWIIALKDMREALRSRTTYFQIVIMLVLSFSFFSGLSGSVETLSKQGAGPDELAAATRELLGVIISTLPLVFNMLFSSFLSQYAVITDKSKRVLESLLATPLTLRQLWTGKSLAIAVPSTMISFLVSVIALVLLNILFVIPISGRFVMPAALPMVTGWILVPAVAFLVTLAVTLLQLIMSNPRIANFAFILVFFAVFSIPMIPSARSLDLSLVYVVLAGALVVVDIFLSRLLTKEKVILSSKG